MKEYIFPLHVIRTVGRIMWTVKGRKYDLTYFKHPGGPVALGLARGREAVDLIRSYHPLAEDKVYQILEKFAVPDSTETNLAPVVDTPFKEELSPFGHDVRDLLREYTASPNYARNQWKRWGEYLVMLVVFLGLLKYFLQGYWWALVPTPLALWVLGVHTFHDASHFAVVRNSKSELGWLVNAGIPYLFTWFSSPLNWNYQHVVGHHPYVNMRGRDPDFYHHSPLHRYMPWHRFEWLHQFQQWGIFLVWWLGMLGQSFVVDWRFMKLGSFQRVVPVKLTPDRKALHQVGRVITFLVFYTWPFWLPTCAEWSAFKCLVWIVVPWGIISSLYMSIAHAGHIITETADAPPCDDFYEHQVRHTHNFASTQGTWWTRALNFYASGGLNLQIEHHLYPGLNHGHLRELAPRVRDICTRYGIPYHESPCLFTAIGRHLARIREMGNKKVE